MTETFDPADLFNCCAGGTEPPTSEREHFAGLDVSGVRDANAGEKDETCCVSCDDGEADFWTVYARHRADAAGLAICDAITDAPTRERAEAIACHLSLRWGIPSARRRFTFTPDNCPSQHWNDGADQCADCGAFLG